jgi:hypothetical protein
MSFANSATTQLHIALDEVEASLRFVSVASHLRPRLGPLIQWSCLDTAAKDLVNNFLKQNTDRTEIIYRGMIAFIYGGFEQFVREVITEVVTVVDRNTTNFNQLSDAMRIQNMVRTGYALKTAAEPPDHLVFDYHLLCRNIGSCIPDSENFRLNAEAFTLLVWSVAPKHLTDMFHKVGIDLNMDEFGKTQALREILGTSGTRQTANAAEEYLRKFIQTRNRIAHTGSGGITIAESDVVMAVGFFRAFSGTLADLVHKGLEKRLGTKNLL